jgi:hypothetical protein
MVEIPKTDELQESGPTGLGGRLSAWVAGIRHTFSVVKQMIFGNKAILDQPSEKSAAQKEESFEDTKPNSLWSLREASRRDNPYWRSESVNKKNYGNRLTR